MESMKCISNPPLSSGNTNIYGTDLTVLIEIHAGCQPSVCTIVFKCFPKFLTNIKSSLCLSGIPTAPVGTHCGILVYDKEGATRE